MKKISAKKISYFGMIVCISSACSTAMAYSYNITSSNLLTTCTNQIYRPNGIKPNHHTRYLLCQNGSYMIVTTSQGAPSSPSGLELNQTPYSVYSYFCPTGSMSQPYGALTPSWSGPNWNSKVIGSGPTKIYYCGSYGQAKNAIGAALCASDWANAPTNRQYVYSFGGGAQAALQIPGTPRNITYSGNQCTAQCPLANGATVQCSWTQGQLQNLPSKPTI